MRSAAGERRLRILSLLRAGDPDLPEAERICQVAAEITGVSGAGLMLTVDDMSQGSVCASDDVSAVVEQLQYTLAEGPCIDASREDRPILEPDLVNMTMSRWVAFSGPAIDAGVRAIFGFPLRVGAVRLGALNLYRDRPGNLGDEHHAEALVVADVAAHAILAMQAGAPPGQLAEELQRGSDFQFVVHQAAGMVAVQLGVSILHALVRLRAHAFATSCPLARVAGDVVAGRLRFGPEMDGAEANP